MGINNGTAEINKLNIYYFKKDELKPMERNPYDIQSQDVEGSEKKKDVYFNFENKYNLKKYVKEINENNFSSLINDIKINLLKKPECNCILIFFDSNDYSEKIDIIDKCLDKRLKVYNIIVILAFNIKYIKEKEIKEKSDLINKYVIVFYTENDYTEINEKIKSVYNYYFNIGDSGFINFIQILNDLFYKNTKNEYIGNISNYKATINILVMGRTGCGKSTLINLLLDEKRAREGIGYSITKLYTQYVHKKYPITFTDTIGFEDEKSLNRMKNFLSIYEEFFNEGKSKFHLVLYLINAGNERTFMETELDLIDDIRNKYNLPIFFVITHSRTDEASQEFKESVKISLIQYLEEKAKKEKVKLIKKFQEEKTYSTSQNQAKQTYSDSQNQAKKTDLNIQNPQKENVSISQNQANQTNSTIQNQKEKNISISPNQSNQTNSTIQNQKEKNISISQNQSNQTNSTIQNQKEKNISISQNQSNQANSTIQNQKKENTSISQNKANTNNSTSQNQIKENVSIDQDEIDENIPSLNIPYSNQKISEDKAKITKKINEEEETKLINKIQEENAQLINRIYCCHLVEEKDRKYGIFGIDKILGEIKNLFSDEIKEIKKIEQKFEKNENIAEECSVDQENKNKEKKPALNIMKSLENSKSFSEYLEKLSSNICDKYYKKIIIIIKENNNDFNGKIKKLSGLLINQLSNELNCKPSVFEIKSNDKKNEKKDYNNANSNSFLSRNEKIQKEKEKEKEKIKQIIMDQVNSNMKKIKIDMKGVIESYESVLNYFEEMIKKFKTQKDN